MKIEIIEDKGVVTEPNAFYPPLLSAARRSCRSALPMISSVCLFAAAVFCDRFIGICLLAAAAVLTAVSVIRLKVSGSAFSADAPAALPVALIGVFLLAACAAEEIAVKKGITLEASGFSLFAREHTVGLGLTFAVLLFAVGLAVTAMGISNINRTFVKNIPTSAALPLAVVIEGVVTVGIAFLCFADCLSDKIGALNKLSVGSKERLTVFLLAVASALLFTHLLLSFIRIRKVKKCCFQNLNTNI